MNFPLIATSQTEHMVNLRVSNQGIFSVGLQIRHGHTEFLDLLQNRLLLPFSTLNLNTYNDDLLGN